MGTHWKPLNLHKDLHNPNQGQKAVSNGGGQSGEGGEGGEGGNGLGTHKALGVVGAVWALWAVRAVRAVGAEEVWAHIGSL